ncbi:MAG: hypothetical protein J6Y65_01835 [Eggerthellaceae bacterium]|nr:hypothetical protein [Eggerthellaceae bacterium]
MQTPKKRADRAVQFAPFDSLAGYFALAHEQEKTVEPKHEITEEDSIRLSEVMGKLRKGVMVKVVHYVQDGYVTTVGMVSDIAIPYRTITVVKTRIAFEDISDISVVK